MTPEQIEEFLDKLNDDEDFRDDLCNDPIAVFESYGIDTSGVEVPETILLPDVGEVNRNRDAYRDALFPPDDGYLHRPIFKLQATGE